MSRCVVTLRVVVLEALKGLDPPEPEGGQETAGPRRVQVPTTGRFGTTELLVLYYSQTWYYKLLFHLATPGQFENRSKIDY